MTAGSRAMKAPSSWIVVISGTGNTTVEFLSTAISASAWSVRKCKVTEWRSNDRRRLAQGADREQFAFRGNDLGPLLPLRLRLMGHGLPHTLRQLDVLQLD